MRTSRNYNRAIKVMVTPEIEAAVMAEAKDAGLSVSDVVRFALRDRYALLLANEQADTAHTPDQKAE